MSARDELAELIATTKYKSLRPSWAEREDRSPVKYFSRKQADAILAAGYSKPRTITTAEELKAEYEGLVVLDAEGMVWKIDGKSSQWVNIEDGDSERYSDDDIALPATVLHEPAP